MHLGRILTVDDDKINLQLLNTILKGMDFDVLQALNAKVGLEILEKENDIDLIVTDLMMPEMDGYEFTKKVKSHPEMANIPVIMLTSLGQKKDKIKALESGVDDFLNKPLDKTELTLRVQAFLKVKKYNDSLSNEKKQLELTLSEKENTLVKTLADLKNLSDDKLFLIQLLEDESMKLLSAYRQLKETNIQMRNSNLEIIASLATAAEFRDNETGMHIKRVSNYCALIAKKVGLPDDKCEEILNTSPMHDIGKIGIPDIILLKPGSLTPDEWKIMKTHAYIGYTILNGIKSDIMNTAATIAYTHHEKWNGEGYPRGLKKEEIPLEGRICAIADVFDALTSKRVYKDAFSVEKAVDILKEGRASHFDPDLLDLFIDALDEVVEIKEKYQDTDEDLLQHEERITFFTKSTADTP